MAKNINSEEYDAGTLVKLEVLSKFTTEWLYVILNQSYVDKFYLYDFFAGSGHDTNGHEGSPLIMLKRLTDNCNKMRAAGQIVELIVNDNMPSKIKILKTKCEEHISKCAEKNNCPYHKNLCPCSVSIRYESRDFKDLFSQEYDHLISEKNPFSLMFIDQYGIKEVDGPVFERLSRLKRADIIFFTATGHAWRFSEHEDFQKYINFNKIPFSGKDYDQSHRQLRDYYASMIPHGVEYYLAPFTIRKEDSGMICGLIFGASNLYGLEKFLTAVWSIDPKTGEANFDIDDDRIKKNEPSLFIEHDRPKKMDRYKNNLKEYLHSWRTNTEVYIFTLINGFLPTHATKILVSLENEQNTRLKTVSIDGSKARKGAYYINKNGERIRIAYE